MTKKKQTIKELSQELKQWELLCVRFKKTMTSFLTNPKNKGKLPTFEYLKNKLKLKSYDQVEDLCGVFEETTIEIATKVGGGFYEFQSTGECQVSWNSDNR